MFWHFTLNKFVCLLDFMNGLCFKCIHILDASTQHLRSTFWLRLSSFCFFIYLFFYFFACSKCKTPFNCKNACCVVLPPLNWAKIWGARVPFKVMLFLLWRNRLQLKLFRISIKCDPHASSASLFWSHHTFSLSISFSLSLSFALYLSLLSFHCTWQCATVLLSIYAFTNPYTSLR